MPLQRVGAHLHDPKQAPGVPPAVGPRSPLPRTGHNGPRASDVARQVVERLGVERGLVVQAEIEVGLRHVLPTGPATTEQYSDHAVNLTQPAPQLPQLLITAHPCIMADQAACAVFIAQLDQAMGIDNDPKTILIARDLSARYTNVEFQAAALTDLPSLDCDVVTAIALVHHLDHALLTIAVQTGLRAAAHISCQPPAHISCQPPAVRRRCTVTTSPMFIGGSGSPSCMSTRPVS